MRTKFCLCLSLLMLPLLSRFGIVPTAAAADPPPPPVVHLLATDPIGAEEGSDPATFLAVRIGRTNESLTVLYNVGGTANNGEDYETLSGEVTIPEGAHFAPITVTPLDDFLVEAWESVVVAVEQPPVWPPPYIVSWPSVAVAHIEDNDPAPTNQPPAVAIINPPDGAVFEAPVNIALVARAWDRDGRVVTVEFFDGATSLGVVTNSNWPPIVRPTEVTADNALDFATRPEVYPDPGVSPSPIPLGLFRLVWTNVPPGEHVLTAVATDNDGDSTTSEPIEIKVTEPSVQPVVTVRATDPEAAEPDPSGTRLDTATFKVHRTGSTDFPLTVWYRLSGMAVNGVDYRELPRTVVIPRGESAADVIVEPVDDNLVEGDESVIITVVPPICIEIYPPPPDCYLVGRPSVARAVIHDNDVPPNRPPVVGIIRPLDGSVFLAPATIQIVAQAFDVDGHVVTVEFFEGTNSLGIVTNGPPSDAASIPPFRIEWERVPPGRYVLTAVATDDDGATGRSRPVEIKVVPHPLPPVVNIEATDPVASEPGVLTVIDFATFEVSRSGPTERPLWVFYSIGGTASNGEDYHALPGRVEIPPGASSTDIDIFALHDELVEGTETVVLRLQPPPMASASPLPVDYYIIGSNFAARAIILDNDSPPTNHPPRVAIVRPEEGDVFPAAADITILAAAFDLDGFVRTVEFFEGENSLGIVSNNWSGTDSNGPRTGGNTGVNDQPEQVFRLVWKDVPPGTYALTAKATDNRGASTTSEPVRIRVSWPMPAVVTITAPDPYASEGPMPIVNTDANGRVTFGTPDDAVDTARFTVRRNGRTNDELTVYYSLRGTAANGVDYRRLTGEVTIPPGAWTADVMVVPIDDTLPEPLETVVAQLEPVVCPAVFPPPPGCYVVGDPDHATAYIRDNDLNLSPKVEIVAPRDHTVFVAPVDIEINVLAVDPDGWVPKVQFYADGVLIGEQEIVFIMPPPPGEPQTFSMVWTNAPLGAHVLTAKATDNRGAMSVSDPIHIFVISEPPIPVVTIEAIVPVTQEQDPRILAPLRPAVFEVTRRGGDMSKPLRVFYNISGTAENGVDYNKLAEDVVIEANEPSAQIYVVAIDDELVEGTETVILALEQLRCVTTNVPPPEGCYIVGRPGRDVAYIRDNDSPPNQAPKVAIIHPANGSVFTAPADLRLVAAAEDPDGWVATVEFFEGENSLGIVTNRPWILEPAHLTYLENEMVSGLRPTSIPIPPPFVLHWPNVPRGEYVLTAVATDNEGASTRSAPVEIKVRPPDDPPVVNIMAIDPFAREGTDDTATFRVRRVGNTNDSVTVWYSISGSASNGVDYLEIPQIVTIPAGRRSARIVIDPMADNLPEYVETVILVLQESPLDVYPPPYVVGHPAGAGAIILDNEWERPVTQNLPEGRFHLRLPLPAGLPYRLEASGDLIHWYPVVDQVLATDNGVAFVEPGDAQVKHRFYRVVPEVEYQAEEE